MSHFTLLVIGDDVDAKLQPFRELDLPEDEIKKDPRAKFIEGIKHSEVEEKFKEFLKKEKEYLTTNKINYTSANDWVRDWFGYIFNEELGSWGYYRNPQSKWDWYTIGGRWSGFFTLKNGAVGKLGEPGLYGREEEDEKPNKADQAKKGDIDWEAMVLEQIERGKKIWKDVEEKKDIITPEMRYFIYGITEDDSLESYLERRKKFPTTYAVLKDGNWYEKGEMGWWGITTDEKEDSEWNQEFQKLIEDLPDDTLLTVVDCHI